jgi:hypothetical protein
LGTPGNEPGLNAAVPLLSLLLKLLAISLYPFLDGDRRSQFPLNFLNPLMLMTSFNVPLLSFYTGICTTRAVDEVITTGTRGAL